MTVQLLNKKSRQLCFYALFISIFFALITLVFLRKPNSPTLRMTSFISNFSTELRPEEIETIEEYTLLNTLFSPLVLFDNDGRLESNLASSFSWEDPTTLVFEFSRNQKTIDGYAIDAWDALASYKRMILINNNMHGNLGDRLEIPPTFKKISDDLPGLFVQNDKLYLKTKKKDYFILHILASADFAILPRRSFDHETLEIIDFRNTTGPYYLESENDLEAILSQNEGHFRLTSSNAAKIRCLKFKVQSEGIDAFKNGHVDHIPTASPLSSASYVNLAKDPDTALHETRDIMLYFGAFTHASRKRLTNLERFVVASAIQKAIQEEIPKLTNYASLTEQFFHEDGVGALTDEELSSEKKKAFKEIEVREIDSKVFSLTIEASPEMAGIFKPMLEKVFKEVKFIPLNRTSKRIFDSDADVVFSSVDVGLKEDFTGISFAIEWGLFPFSKEESKQWLEALAVEENSHLRANAIRDLNVKSLIADPTLIPLYRLPVFAITQNGWRMDLPKLWVTERLWQIYKD